MLHKKGIVRKTFLFSALLIILVITVSFTILYFAMPRYYLFKKNQMLQTELEVLAESLKSAETKEECSSLIAVFVDSNNVTALSLGEDQMPLIELSSPFVSMDTQKDKAFFSTSLGYFEGENTSNYTVRIYQENTFDNTDETEAEKTIDQSFKTLISYENKNTITLTAEIGTDLINEIKINGTLQPIDEAKDVILSLIPYVLSISIMMGLFLSWIYAKQISKPILQISEATQKMQALAPDAISGIRTEDELGLLSENLDALYISLWENIDSLKKEMEKVSRLELSKTEMMQSASHELKTPIAALSGMLDGMIDNIGVYKDKDKYLLECKSQTEKLSLLVGEILNALKTDISEEETEVEDTEVDRLIMKVLEDCTASIHKKQLNVTTEFFPAVIKTNPSAFYRVLSNLIGNAVRHTPPDGEIVIQLSREQFTIENQCSPIPKEELPKLFEPFYTRSYSRNKVESGTGLGLYIVKRNLERLNIPYEVESTQMGIKFSLYFM